MSKAGTCSACGQDVPDDAQTRGLCPRCLMACAMAGLDEPARPSSWPTFVAPAPAELAGEFPDLEILALLGQGGMGAVYKARQRSLDRITAVKIFPREVTNDPTFGERFRHEAKVLARLSHPHIVAAYEFGQSDRYCYFVMEFVDGVTLRHLLGKALPPAEALAIAARIAGALAFAHQHGVVHRDIKPENILFDASPQGESPLTESGRMRIADFGLAKLLDHGPLDFTMTDAAQVLGTAHYMAPEQRETPTQVDHRADIYSLGVILYEMLTGELPIGVFPAPSERADVGEAVDRLVLRCLAKDPAGRFGSALDLEKALRDVVHGRGASHTRARRHPWLAVTGVLVLAAAGALTALLVRGIGTKPPSQRGRGGLPAGTQPAPRPEAPSFPPEAFLPYQHLRRPEFAEFRQGRAEWLNEVGTEYGPGRVATVWVHNLPGDVVTFIHDEVLAAAGARRRNSIGAFHSLNIMVAPVDDLDAAAERIDFGKVTSVDRRRRVITIEADHTKLPDPLQPEIADPNSPEFYRRNLEDLGSWDRNRRLRAVKRIREASPRQRRKEMAAALAGLLRDPYHITRQLAVEALGTWGTPENLPALIAGLKDKEDGVRHRVIAALGRFKDVRAAEPVAALLATDREQAAAALCQMGSVAEPAVAERLGDKDEQVRLAAIGILGTIGTAESLPALRTVASGPDATCAVAAHKAIRAIERRARP